MAEEKVPTEVVVEEEEQKPVQEGLEVDLSGKKEEPKPEADLAKKIAEQNEVIQGLQKQLNSLSGLRRINERLEKELGQLKQQPIQQPLEKPIAQDELDKLVEAGDWKTAVKKLAAQEAQEIIKQKDIERQIRESEVQNQRIVERSKKEVVERYPDLDPETGNEESPVSQAFNSVMNEHPEYLQNPYGPVLTMMEMEKKLESEGVDVSKLRRSPLQKPIIKRGAVAGTSLPPGRAGISTDKYVLTKEQKEWCDYHGVKYEDYAKNARTLETGGEVAL